MLDTPKTSLPIILGSASQMLSLSVLLAQRKDLVPWKSAEIFCPQQNTSEASKYHNGFGLQNRP